MKWNLDPAHSELQFKARHMMITTVSGKIEKFETEVESDDEQFNNAHISASMEMNSITTGDAQRDGHLHSGDFFELEKFPLMKFKGTALGNGKLKGELTIKDITKPIELDVEFGGVGKDPWGNTKAGFSLSGKIKRSDWNLNWNAALEAGGVLVSDEIKIAGEIQLSKAQ
ncbi:MAG: YceI family protein [Flavobacteriales bacterium]